MATQREEYRSHHRKQLAYEQEYRAKALWALRAQKAPFIKMAKEKDPLTAMMNIDTLIRPEPLTKFYERLYSAIALKEAKEYYKQQIQVKETMLGFGISDTWLAALQEWLRTWLALQITQMTDYTKRILLAIISEGLQNGDSYDEMIDKMQATGLDRVRAANIARTETNRALGWAKYDALGKLPYPVRVIWIAARDKRTRGAEPNDKADHFDLNGQMQEYNQPFTDIRSGAKMLFPGDVSLGAGAGDVCNCRCTIGSKRIN
jgi:hypothetical protein